jgi:hypothetical protein
MKRLVMTKLRRTDSLSDGHGGFVEMETSEGPLEIRFTYEDAERLIAALQAARKKIQDDRVKSGAPPLADKPKAPESWETAIDPVNQVAVILARFPDHTTQETKIPRTEIAAITEFLKQASTRFEGSADMRQ